MTQRFSPIKTAGQAVTLADMVPLIWGRRGVALLVFACFLALTAFWVPLWQPLFRASGQIGFLPATPAPLALKDATPPTPVFQISDLDTEMAMVRGTAVLSAARAVLQGDGIVFDPEPSPLARWLGIKPAQETMVVPPGMTAERVHENRDIAILRGKIKTAQIDNARVIEISLFDADPERARRMLDAVIDSYVWKRANDLRRKLADQYDETVRQRAQAEAALAQNQQALMDWQDQHPLTGSVVGGGGGSGAAASGTSDLGRDLENIRAQRQAAQIDLLGLQARQQAIAATQGDVGQLMKLPEISNSETVRELNLRLAVLRGTKADLGRRYGPRHPLVMANDAQILQAQDDVRAAISAQIAAIDRDAQNAATRFRTFAQEYNRVLAQAVADNRDRLAFDQLSRKLDAATAEVSVLTDRARIMQSELAALRPDVEIVQIPETPGKPVFPSRKHIAMIAIALSALLAMAAAILREYFDRALHRASEAEILTGLPIFAVLPRVSPHPARRVTEEENEAIGHLQTILRLRRDTARAGNDDGPAARYGGRVVCITSPMPGEGKSRLAQKMAVRFAQNSQRVLLLDGDLRRPTLEKQPIAGRVGPVEGNNPDFSLVLQGDATPDQAIFPVRLDDEGDGKPGDVYYDFLGAQDAVSSALAGQLMAEKLLGLMQDLRHRYDYIVVDAPPVLAVADAIWLMRAADDRLLLIRAQKSRREDILDAVRRLEQAGCAADGLIFSGVSRRGAYYGGKKRRKRP
ncbi:GumC family protein [Thalassospira mesophila]|uniref:AAA domain-containing protein n=1 Tax=Thalassospira mesophila TaxID=1293891 RepID=A0A1Y2L3K4_9PROT|nr:tyrosine-protein kinase domain-containing protein [Thalassospira mesophila]OSQ39757.1 hypothetical protein TMES_07345 [Thalassospira mesophila]